MQIHGCDGDRLLREYLASRNDPCPLCGYNLHQLTGRHCPECGQELELQIALTSPRMRAFITGVIGLAAALGFSVLILIWALYLLLAGDAWGMPRRMFIVLIVESVVTLALLLAWVRWGGRIRLLPTRARWTLAVACCFVPIINMISFFSLDP